MIKDNTNSNYVCHSFELSMAIDNRYILKYAFFLYLLESPHWGNSNKYPKHIMCAEIRIRPFLHVLLLRLCFFVFFVFFFHFSSANSFKRQHICEQISL